MQPFTSSVDSASALFPRSVYDAAISRAAHATATRRPCAQGRRNDYAPRAYGPAGAAPPASATARARAGAAALTATATVRLCAALARRRPARAAACCYSLDCGIRIDARAPAQWHSRGVITTGRQHCSRHLGRGQVLACRARAGCRLGQAAGPRNHEHPVIRSRARARPSRSSPRPGRPLPAINSPELKLPADRSP